MLVTSTLGAESLERVATFWAGLHNVEPSAFESPGVVVGVHPADEFRAVLLLRVNDTCVVTVPDELVSRTEGWSSKTPDQVFDPHLILPAFSDLAPSIIGPALIAYSDRLPDLDPGLEQLEEDDQRIEVMRASCDATEWEHAGMTGELTTILGLVEDERLIAIGNHRTWEPRIAHTGVIVHPDHRRRGLGVRAIRAITRHAVLQNLVVQFRALETNLGSIGIGKRLGFEPWGRTMTVRIKA